MRARSLLLVAIALVGAPAASAAGRPPARPALILTSPSPIVVSGTRFKPNERVRIRVVLPGRPLLRVVETSAAGRLVARFTGQVPECTGFTISAVGNRGSRVFHRQVPPPCGIVIQP